MWCTVALYIVLDFCSVQSYGKVLCLEIAARCRKGGFVLSVMVRNV